MLNHGLQSLDMKEFAELLLQEVVTAFEATKKRRSDKARRSHNSVGDASTS
jgi:hypothetical protein